MTRRITSFCLVSMLSATAATTDTPPSSARTIFMRDGDMVTIHCPALMACAIEAPEGEKFISAELGDPNRWPDSKDSLPSRFYTLKPAFNGLKTTLHMVTDHDNQYGFLVEESRVDPDYSVILRVSDAAGLKRIAAPPSVVPRAELEIAQKQLQEAIRALAAARTETEKKVQDVATQAKQEIPAQMRSYQFDRQKAQERPWSVSDILAGPDKTYIKRSVKANDLPSVFAKSANGKPELVVAHYDPDRDVYVIPQRIEDGYLSFGGQKHEKKLEFHLPQGA